MIHGAQWELPNPGSSLRDGAICIVPLALDAPVVLSFCIARNYNREEVKLRVFAAVYCDPKQKQTLGLATNGQYRWVLPPTVSTAVEKRKAVKANPLIFDSKIKTNHVNLAVEVFSQFKQQPNRVEHAAKIPPLPRKCGVRGQLSKH